MTVELNSKKEEPTSEIRHRLKNPLTAILLKIQIAQKFLVQSDSSDPKIKKALEILSGSQKDIHDLVEKIDTLIIGD